VTKSLPLEKAFEVLELRDILRGFVLNEGLVAISVFDAVIRESNISTSQSILG
jgi:hypothetical protein